MHELSIVLSLIEGAEEEITRMGGGRVCAVHLRLGPLSGVVKEALLFSYDLACEGTSLEGSSLVSLRICRYASIAVAAAGNAMRYRCSILSAPSAARRDQS